MGRHKQVELHETQLAFLDYLTDPRTAAEKGTQAAWAEAHGIVQQTASNWKKEPMFRRAWEARLHDMNIRPDRIQTVIDEVYGIIQGGTPADKIKAATLYLQYVNRLSPNKLPAKDEPEKPLEEMTDEELADLANNVVSLRSQRAG